MIDRLRPHPHRGDVIAAGAIPLSMAAFLIDLHMTQWSLGVRFVVVLLITALLMTVGWLAQLETETPRPYHSILLLAGLASLGLALFLLAELLGSARPPGAGGLAWIFAIEAATAALAARRANSAVCTLITALSTAVAVEAFVSWVFRPHGLGTFRAMLFVLTLCFGIVATRLRDSQRRHAVALIDAAGVTALGVGFTYVLGRYLVVSIPLASPFGWNLFLLAAGFALIAYAAVDREPGPGYLGVTVLVLFIYLTGFYGSHRGSLVGWPLLLLVLGAAGLAIGLRPRKALPPAPDANINDPAPTVPLPRENAP